MSDASMQPLDDDDSGGTRKHISVSTEKHFSVSDTVTSFRVGCIVSDASMQPLGNNGGRGMIEHDGRGGGEGGNG